MRWTRQQLNQPLFPDQADTNQPVPGQPRATPAGKEDRNNAGPAEAAGAALPLLPLAGLVKSVTTPEFVGITFHEVLAKSALNKVPSTSSMPFGWTVNPYRGCSHACVYCFARKSHSYLDFDPGKDFDSQVVVKVNVAEVLHKELRKPSWQREHVALGTNTDPYQRAEGRYKLMPGIINALADSGTPFSILTKGTLLARDLPLLRTAGKQVSVGVGISLALLDEGLAQALEPGTPAPQARLALIGKLRDAGLPCGVMAMPILPWLTDSPEALDALFASLARAGATGVSAGALFLRPGTREWFMQWLAREYPALVGSYRRLYGSGAYASKEYRQWLAARVNEAKARNGFTTQAFVHDPRREEARYPAGSLPPPERESSRFSGSEESQKAGTPVGTPAFSDPSPTLF
ncbi:Rv2578c family radical SAM protein [Arthrobacter sp. H35-D1]|uniref:Rv2578c family radical SAM protein n=1 Tax=Arthrobacter sp. H35-D1 TaxID=3046202 RepID=UPI0024BAC916|nr:Rv2578c family radical SAM protein [Arthrobacter sp. H35-D1]MDJ0313757.1 Rv2578c family radical SAM protein [Arthrobacter sp. H35-D1]